MSLCVGFDIMCLWHKTYEKDMMNTFEN